ncbi:hypothetical protein [Brevifollis gellanilyticus]|uniref:Uncharacterized protein n=1 Tax=Brevifollis gellanilyticus TaxID=748831 RepID=A0A512M2J5_9BACT|nr:hypothetical protein [Brevifollis gellanilyticus]GEP40928.1 hypothetical protein BGE01nite_02190 [Brevifollis gellanilyticus]
MKTARLSQIIARCGKPDLHLVLVDPKKDRALQAAVKAHKVMTLRQNLKGTQADRGIVGFDPGPSRQYLIFPKSLKPFQDRDVVGIHYDLFSEEPVRPPPAVRPVKKKTRTATRPHPPKPPRPNKKAAKEKPARAAAHEPPAKEKILPFKQEKTKKAEEPPKHKDPPEVAAMKTQIKRAITALKQGKQVAAFHVLQRIVGEG